MWISASTLKLLISTNSALIVHFCAMCTSVCTYHWHGSHCPISKCQASFLLDSILRRIWWNVSQRYAWWIVFEPGLLRFSLVIPATLLKSTSTHCLDFSALLPTCHSCPSLDSTTATLEFSGKWVSMMSWRRFIGCQNTLASSILWNNNQQCHRQSSWREAVIATIRSQLCQEAG